MTCEGCGKALGVFDEGFYKKMVSRGEEPRLCVACTARYFGFTEEKAWEMIRRFQAQGCMLFPCAGAQGKSEIQ